MTLDEAIKHAEEKAKELGCTECGKEHKQLAGWLKQVKGIYDAIEEIEQMDISKIGYRFGFIEDVIDIIRKHTGVQE